MSNKYLFSLNTSNYVIGSVYIPLTSSSHVYDSHIQTVESITSLFPNYMFIFCGNCNLPEIFLDNVNQGLLYAYSSLIRDLYS